MTSSWHLAAHGNDVPESRAGRKGGGVLSGQFRKLECMVHTLGSVPDRWAVVSILIKVSQSPQWLRSIRIQIILSL